MWVEFFAILCFTVPDYHQCMCVRIFAFYWCMYVVLCLQSVRMYVWCIVAVCVIFFGVHVFLCLKCVRMCVLCIVSTTVYAVFNCVCIIRSSVCSTYVSYAAEARGRRMLAANYNRGAAFSLFIIFIISFY